MKILMLILMALSLSSAQPKPFDLELGVSTKEQVMGVMKKEGGIDAGRKERFIVGKIVNNDVEGRVVKNLPIEHLQEAVLWFYKGVLYKIEYIFSDTPGKWNLLYRYVAHKYGDHQYRLESKFGDHKARWKFENAYIHINVSPMEGKIYLIYEHIPLSNQVETRDREILERDIAKPKRWL